MNTFIPLESTHEARIGFVLSKDQAILFMITISLLAAISLHLYREFKAFIALGPGGTPQTLAGFLKIYLLNFVKIRDPTTPPTLIPNDFPSSSLLNLPHRAGSRPETRGIAPHRQVSQQGDPKTYALLASSLAYLTRSHPQDVYQATSCFEAHSTGFFAKHALGSITTKCRGEVCHAHPSDGGSLHLVLSPADLKVVLERGWGERHPLARGGWFERFVPESFAMVYAPRDAWEVEVVLRITRAAAGHVMGRDFGYVGGEEEV